MPPKLILAPANATVSTDVSVTLGCKSNVQAKMCQWFFAPASDPGTERELSPFSPTSKKNRGFRQANDCSLTIKSIGEKYEGFWTCSVLPLTDQSRFMRSKPAYLRIYKPSERREPTSTTTERFPEVTSPAPKMPRSLPYFVIDRNPYMPLKIVWHLGDSVRDLRQCVWITPNRLRITSHR